MATKLKGKFEDKQMSIALHDELAANSSKMRKLETANSVESETDTSVNLQVGQPRFAIRAIQASTRWKVAIFFICLLQLAFVFCIVSLIMMTIQFADNVERAVPIITATTHPYEHRIFDELSAEEVQAAEQCLLKSALAIERENVTHESNYIYLIDWLPPEKSAIKTKLPDYYAHGNITVERKARVVIFHGRDSQQSVQEYQVELQSCAFKTVKRVPFYARQLDTPEWNAMLRFVHKLLADSGVNRILAKVFNAVPCENRTITCLRAIYQMPHLFKLRNGTATRRTWLRFYRDMPGFFLHPIRFEVLVQHYATDVSTWTVDQVAFLNYNFDNILELLQNESLFEPEEYAPNSFARGKLPTVSNVPREHAGPVQNYSVIGKLVRYEGWSFFFTVRTTLGLQLFDVRFRGKSVVYELGLQETLTVYAGPNNFDRTLMFADSIFSIGALTMPLLRGLDCPHYASYFGAHHYQYGNLRNNSDSVCIFVHDEALPLRRHRETEYTCNGKQTDFLSGMPSKVLVVRSIPTMFNYDYIIDYRFYTNGVLETRVHLSGYIHTSYYKPSNLRREESFPTKFGYFLDEQYMLGLLHNHLLHFKVDIDIDQPSNVYEKVRIVAENTCDKDVQLTPQQTVKAEIAKNESEAIVKFNFDRPTLHIFKQNSSSPASYRILLETMSKLLLCDESAVPPGVSWAANQMVVTSRKEESEAASSSIYNGVDPFAEHVVNFEKFSDGDSLVNQDLVAWLTVGGQHLPRSEDLPIVQTTPPSGMRFSLIPFNYFKNDPSINSRDNMCDCNES